MCIRDSSGDSACVIPAVSLGEDVVRRIEEETAAVARELGVIGLMNAQYALQQDDEGTRIYVLEVNPRASRTVPYVSKAVGVPLARVATRVMAGRPLADMDLPGWEESQAQERVPGPRGFAHVAVKEAVLPFRRFPGVDPMLGVHPREATKRTHRLFHCHMGKSTWPGNAPLRLRLLPTRQIHICQRSTGHDSGRHPGQGHTDSLAHIGYRSTGPGIHLQDCLLYTSP